MKKFFLVTALLFPLYSFAQTVEDNKETVTEDDIIYNENGNYYDAEGNYLVDYDGQDDKEKKGIKYNPVFIKYIEGSEDLDFYRPRNIEGASAQLAEETRRNHWLGRYIYNYGDPNPNEIRPETDPIINSGENEDNAILFNGMFNPVIDDEKCTACGFCLSRCPTQAISYEVFGIQDDNYGVT